MIFTEISRLNRINLRPYVKNRNQKIQKKYWPLKTASKKQKEALAQRDKVENIFQFCYVLKKKKTE